MKGLTYYVLIHSFIDLCTKTDRTAYGLNPIIHSFIHFFYKYFLRTNNMATYGVLDPNYTYSSQLGQIFEQWIKSLWMLKQFHFEDKF